MYKSIAIMSALIFIFGCTNQVELSGVDKSNFDTSVRPQDDFFQYVNGTWLKETEIPADKSSYGSFHIIYDENQIRLREIIEDAAASNDNSSGSDKQKIGDFFKSYMDSVKIAELGLAPLEDELEIIKNVDSYEELAGLFAHHRIIGVQRPFSFYVDQDDKNSTEYILYFTQSGLGLPDRDYYFNEGEKFENIRAKYIEYIENIFKLSGNTDGASISQTIFDIENQIAEHHWTRVDNRDSEKTYNKFAVSDLNALSPDFNWNNFINSSNLPNIENVIIRQPSYFTEMSNILMTFSVEDWKNYSKFKLLHSFRS